MDGGVLEGGGGRPARWRVGKLCSTKFVRDKQQTSETITTTISNYTLNIRNSGKVGKQCRI